MNLYENIMFSVNQYDEYGDLIDECIFIHIGHTILQFSNIHQLNYFIEQLQEVIKEIKNTFGRDKKWKIIHFKLLQSLGK